MICVYMEVKNQLAVMMFSHTYNKIYKNQWNMTEMVYIKKSTYSYSFE